MRERERERERERKGHEPTVRLIFKRVAFSNAARSYPLPYLHFVSSKRWFRSARPCVFRLTSPSGGGARLSGATCELDNQHTSSVLRWIRGASVTQNLTDTDKVDTRRRGTEWLVFRSNGREKFFSLSARSVISYNTAGNAGNVKSVLPANANDEIFAYPPSWFSARAVRLEGNIGPSKGVWKALKILGNQAGEVSFVDVRLSLPLSLTLILRKWWFFKLPTRRTQLVFRCILFYFIYLVNGCDNYKLEMGKQSWESLRSKSRVR